MSDEYLIAKIETVLDQLRPNIQMDGGDIELVRVEDGVVYIRLHGACVGCPMSRYTVKLGIEEYLKEHIPQVEQVIALEAYD